MIIELKPYSNKPIYEQLILEIKRGIIIGELQPGESLPSVRSLAADIGINMHTVNKVYKYLQQESVLVKEKSGFIVNPNETLTQTPELEEAFKEQLRELIIEKNLYQITDEKLLQMMKDIQKEFLK